jgi:hypothetical protein
VLHTVFEMGRYMPLYHSRTFLFLNFVLALINVCYIQGYFCEGTCQNTIPEVLLQKDARWDTVLELFPGIDTTNTSPLSD